MSSHHILGGKNGFKARQSIEGCSCPWFDTILQTITLVGQKCVCLLVFKGQFGFVSTLCKPKSSCVVLGCLKLMVILWLGDASNIYVG
jgi:hypothetical protein